MKGISTTKRYLYLNIYAWILLSGAFLLGIIPLYRLNIWIILPQVITVAGMGVFAIRILMQFPRKKREYQQLMERNSKELRPDTFWCYADAPCGRLLMWLVLKDLGYPRSTYHSIVKKYG